MYPHPARLSGWKGGTVEQEEAKSGTIRADPEGDEHGVGTIRGIAKEFGVHRRMVREALASAVPGERKAAVRESPKLDRNSFINTILRQIGKHLVSSDILPIASGGACARRNLTSKFRNQQFASTCASANLRWG